MPCMIVVGTQWGDEGKGKVIDLLADQAEHVIRAQGGNNAGHTVVTDNGEYKFHLVPSGILHPHTQCYIGAGTVVDPEALAVEIEELTSKGISLEGRLWISPLAHLVFPHHHQVDKLNEEAKGKDAIGTTGKGIGPAYADKIGRIGIRFAEWLQTENSSKNPLAIKLKPFVANVEDKIHRAIASKEKILFEGAQGTFLDITFGTYPFVTASSTIAAGICAGAGVGPREINHVLGVVKAYATRVGAGPFPTEIKEAKHPLCDYHRTQEYGTTTGRKRRIGWLDAVLVQKAIQLNGIDSLAITKLDILDELPEIRIATGYQLRGKECDSWPTTLDDFSHIEPIYEELPGWQQPTGAITEYDVLPKAAKHYLSRIEELCGVPISLISLGPSRKQTILREDLFAQKEWPSE